MINPKISHPLPKRSGFIPVWLCAILLLASSPIQDIQHQVGVINIEVPVRVFEKDRFVPHLKLEDFELFENGRPQIIEAVYMIRKTSVENSEEHKKFQPEVARHFVLMFEIMEYLPKVGEAIDHFFTSVLLPGDTLHVVTPLKTYHFKSDAMGKMPRDHIGRQLKDRLRKDTKLGNAEYWTLLRDLRESMSGDMPLGQKLQNYENIRDRLTSIRYVDEERMMSFAEFLKARAGQKHIYLFYQRELLPQIEYRELIQLETSLNDQPDLVMKLNELFSFYKRDVEFDVERVKRAFADSSIAVHFMLITQNRPRMQGLSRDTMRMVEHSEDIFSAFREMAQATGGLVTSSSNAASSFARAVDASENYYLLYYSPRDYRADGKFREITVRIKSGGFRVSHRAGYIAN